MIQSAFHSQVMQYMITLLFDNTKRDLKERKKERERDQEKETLLLITLNLLL
jgi:hypothetical protein